MSDQTFISEASAMRILCQEGDFTENQAKLVLAHSLKQAMDGVDYFPMNYIYKRAKENAAKPK